MMPRRCKQSPVVGGAFPGSGVLFTFLLLVLPDEGLPTSLFRCVGEDGVVQFQQVRCPGSAGGEVILKTNVLPWRKGPDPAAASANRAKVKPTNSSQSQAKSRQQDASCWRAEKKRDRVARKLRKGYKPGAGERLRRQRDEAEQYLRRFCR